MINTFSVHTTDGNVINELKIKKSEETEWINFKFTRTMYQ